jgi:hypothetical protein
MRRVVSKFDLTAANLVGVLVDRRGESSLAHFGGLIAKAAAGRESWRC